MLASTVVRRGRLVRELRYLPASASDEKKKKKSEDDDGGGIDLSGLPDLPGPLPDSDHFGDSGGAGTGDSGGGGDSG